MIRLAILLALALATGCGNFLTGPHYICSRPGVDTVSKSDHPQASADSTFVISQMIVTLPRKGKCVDR